MHLSSSKKFRQLLSAFWTKIEASFAKYKEGNIENYLKSISEDKLRTTLYLIDGINSIVNLR